MNYNYLNDTSAQGLSVLLANKRPAQNLRAYIPPYGTPRNPAPLTNTGQTVNTGLFWEIAVPASIALSAYHGYKRNNSVGWTLGWGVLGGIFPIITPVIAFAQGFGRPAR